MTSPETGVDAPGPESGPTSGDRSGDGEERLRAAVRSGLRWSFGTQLGLRALSFVSGIVIFRLLDPADFGIYALALAVSNVLLCLNDLGQETAIVAWAHGDEADHEDVGRTATTFSIAMSVVLYLGCWALAPLIAESAGRPSGAGVIRLVAGVVLIDGIITVPRGLLFRAMHQRQVSVTELTAVPVTIAVSVAIAVLWPGPWGPAIGTFVGAVVNGVATLLYAPAIPPPGFAWGHARRLLAFGVPGAGTTTLDMVLLNVDSFIVANHLGVEALGFYALAFNISSWPSTIITTSVRKVSVAAINQLIRLGGDWRRSFSRSLWMLVALLVPVCLVLALLAQPLVELLYSAKSLPAAPILVWLVVLGGLRVVYGFVVDLLMAQGRTVATFRAQLIWLLAALPAMWIGADLDGARGVAIGHVVAAVVVAGPIYAYDAWNVGIDLGAIARRLVRPSIGAVASIALAAVLLPRLDDPLVQLVVGGAAISVLYGVVGLGPAQLRSLLAVVRPRRLAGAV